MRLNEFSTKNDSSNTKPYDFKNKLSLETGYHYMKDEKNGNFQYFR